MPAVVVSCHREPPREPGGAYRMMAVDVATRDSTFVPGIPSALFKDEFIRTSPNRSYDVGPDRRFLMLLAKESPAIAVTEIHLVLNWLDELERKLASR